MGNIFDNKRKFQILNSFEKPAVAEVEKAYTEGIYADTPANRKLGRVGMSYSAYANKVNGGSVEHGDIRDFKKETENGLTEYKAEIDGQNIKVSQSGKKKTRSWIVEREGEKMTDESGIIKKFKTAEEAINNVYSVLEDEKSDYKFPAPDYLYFKSVKWNNPDTSDTNIDTIHIHRFGKKKPEITITPKHGLDQTTIVLKNSEMKRLLVGLSKKEDVSLKLDYSEEDMQFWPSNKNYKNKEITLDYDAKNGDIHYHRVPSSSANVGQDFKFPASALDRVVEQFKKEK